MATAPAKSKEVFEYLKNCAKEMRTVSYEEIADVCGLAPAGMGTPLGYIRDEICAKRALPWINALAVSKGARRPSDGFLPHGVSLSGSEEQFWRGMVLLVLAFDWSQVNF